MVVNNIAMKGYTIFIHDLAFNFFGYIPKSGIAGLHDTSMFDFFKELP